MENKDEILQAIADLQRNIDSRFDSIDGRIASLEKSRSKTAKRLNRQQADINDLVKRVRELEKSDAVIWKSHGGRETAIDRDTAYIAFDELGFSRREALRYLEEAGMLSRNERSAGRTKAVRIPSRVPQVVKAVVILADKED